MTLSRRELLRSSALTGAALATGGMFSGLALQGTAAASRKTGVGPLEADPAGMLDLPEGFGYEILARGGHGHPSAFSTYDDGQKVAGDADGAASFAIGGRRTVLVTNHELSGGSDAAERVPTQFDGRPVPTYDPAAPGGTSNIVLDRKNRVTSIYPSIAGTYNNCAGGLTPWGTWLTCEETTATLNGVPHGYVFEVDPEGTRTVATPYVAMGRFAHEAVAIDPRNSDAYMTEDHNNGLIYRFEPDDRSQTHGSLGNGGVLSAMKVAGIDRLGEVQVVGTTLPISWSPVPGGNPDVLAVNRLFPDDTVTRSRKLEGCWWDEDEDLFYFSSADENAPGIEHHGQIWALDPAARTVTLVAHIPVDHPLFDAPDNITVTPWGDLLLCEDGAGEQYLVLCDPATGDLRPFARNALSASEFAGANFSPDGKTLFVNVQNPSTTFAITGRWNAASGRGDRTKPARRGR